jgi:hypothetical protein
MSYIKSSDAIRVTGEINAGAQKITNMASEIIQVEDLIEIRKIVKEMELRVSKVYLGIEGDKENIRRRSSSYRK